MTSEVENENCFPFYIPDRGSLNLIPLEFSLVIQVDSSIPPELREFNAYVYSRLPGAELPSPHPDNPVIASVGKMDKYHFKGPTDYVLIHIKDVAPNVLMHATLWAN